MSGMFQNINMILNPVMEEEGDFLPVFSMEDDELKFDEEYKNQLPILALKNTVLFPGVVFPITVGRDKSIKALQRADKTDKFLGVLTQRDMESEDPDADGLYKVGTIARIMKILKMPDGSTTAILQGRKRFKPMNFIPNEKYLEAEITPLHDEVPLKNIQFNAMISTIREYSQKIIELSPNIPTEAKLMVKNIKNKGFLINFIASNLNLTVEKKQEILETDDYIVKAENIIKIMNQELQLLQIKDQIENKVRGDLEKQQKEYFLNQQLKTIQEELGGNPQDAELNKLFERAQKKDWPTHAKEAFESEITKARRINPQIAEYSVTLSYLEFMLELPWNEKTKDNFNLSRVEKVLNKDHFGLDDVKKRILEHLAVLKLKGDMKAPILCLVGPPGVGKTSLGKSIATALNRKFIRMALGGLHDESEIRGHRRTYIGAMPGRILQSIKKSKTSNPVFLLDEIDKLGKDFRGDPSSALLEVLDPEQNSTFHDNYLDIEYDLSKVLFIATANSLQNIQPALLDRMEIIDISGYSMEEKEEIGKRHLLPKQILEHGLKLKDVTISPTIMRFLIDRYTREAGVRSLERMIAGVMRFIAKKVATHESYNPKLTEHDVINALGPIRFDNDMYTSIDMPGVAVGLAWTRVGGDILFIEASTNPGKGSISLTGNLGDVMKESATTALSYIKAHAEHLGIESPAFEKTDIHIHVPEGAIPKDGPSAGVTMLTAITSAFTRRLVKSHLAMTGEITLRGKVLPVGGIKEKVLAAKRAGLTHILLCEDNRRHVDQIPKDYIEGLHFQYVKTMQEVIDYALVDIKT